MPADKQLLFRREFITAQLHRQLKTVGVEIVEVLHAWPEGKNKTALPRNPRETVPTFPLHLCAVSGLTATSSGSIRHFFFYFSVRMFTSSTHRPQSSTTELRWWFPSRCWCETVHTGRAHCSLFHGRLRTFSQVTWTPTEWKAEGYFSLL